VLTVKGAFGIECVLIPQSNLRYPQLDGSVCSTKNAQDGSVKLDCQYWLWRLSGKCRPPLDFVAAARVIDKFDSEAQGDSN